MVDASNLGIEVTTNRRTSSHIGLHDVADYFDCVGILKARCVLVCLAYDNVPLKEAVSFDQQGQSILTAWFGYDIRSWINLS